MPININACALLQHRGKMIDFLPDVDKSTLRCGLESKELGFEFVLDWASTS
jgi:hypothetical protein